MSSVNSSILRALAYADIFDYPLTGKEIHHWAIEDSQISIPSSKQFFTLPNRQHLIVIRQNKQFWSLHKIALAKRVGNWLSYIPTIKLVAITGALAMLNADENDDIDLMIITSPNRLWLTRFIVVIIMELLGIRRRPKPLPREYSRGYSNKICLNLWLDETSLSVPKPQRNLYTAHEVTQIKPIFNRNNTYRKFLSANSWINHYLPNVIIPKQPKHPNPPKALSLNPIRYPLSSIFERLAFKLQYWYMKPKITRERVSPSFAFFHPRNTGKWVMHEYKKRLKQLGIL